MWTGFKRIVQSGFIGFWRDIFVTLTSVLVMAVALFVIATTLFSEHALDTALAELQQKVDITVYFVTTAPEEDILQLKTSLEGLTDVREVAYVSREEALVAFQERHSDDELTLKALEELGENPLGASLSIRAKEASQYEGIATFLAELPGGDGVEASIIDKVNFSENKIAIDRLNTIIDQEQSVNRIKTIALVVLAVFVAFNTMRLVMYNSREEISVMRLVGAGNTFISAPFVVSGIMQGLAAGVLVLLLLYPALLYNEALFYPFPFFGETQVETFLFNYYITDFGKIFLIIIGSAIAIGAFSSFIAVRRYLKV